MVETRARDRVVGVDLARGIALIGMAATHMLAVQHPDTLRLTWVGWLFAGRASALFAVLAGVSLALVTGADRLVRGAARARARVSIAVRAVLIGIVGLWLAGTGTPVAVILAYYALLFLLSLPFLGLSARTLTVLATAWCLASPMVSHLWRQHLPLSSNDQVNVGALLTDPVAAVRELLVLGYYPALTWLTYLLAGLAVGRIDLREARTAVRLLAVGVGLAGGAWVCSAVLLAGEVATNLLPPDATEAGLGWFDLLNREALGTLPTDSWARLAVAGPHTGTPLDLAGTTGSALAVLGGCLLLVRVPWLRLLTHPVAAAGSMTLTLYTVHAWVLAQGWGAWDSVGYWLTHVAVALVFATVWLLVWRRGPLEWVVHTLSAGAGRLAVPAPATPSVSGSQRR